MIAATEKLITSFRASNPKVIVVLARVIPAGKPPKYSCLPKLNAEPARTAARLRSPAQPVIVGAQATGFDWPTDTITDHVHPTHAAPRKWRSPGLPRSNRSSRFTALRALPPRFSLRPSATTPQRARPRNRSRCLPPTPPPRSSTGAPARRSGELGSRTR